MADHPLESVFVTLEPSAVGEYQRRNLVLVEVAQISAAISLKRIADALTSPANKYGETCLEAVATAMREER